MWRVPTRTGTSDRRRRRQLHLYESWYQATWNGSASHPAVAGAGVAPAPEAGQEQGAIAFVVVAPGAETTEQALLAWSREHLAAHQVPARVTFTDRLPRNSVGKLIRAELPKAAALRPAVGG